MVVQKIDHWTGLGYNVSSGAAWCTAQFTGGSAMERSALSRLATAMILLSIATSHYARSTVLGDSREWISPFLVRVQSTKWPLPTRNPPPRVERDDEGRVVSLWLDGVELEAGDIDIIRSFKQLKRLSLSLTEISDDQLARLADLPRLEGLRLNHTAIGNNGVASLATFPKLKSVCMFRVPASPAAVQALKRERGQLAIGYVHLGN
jgi:hypothetical protein